jgi:hypothetical protein
MSLIKEIFGKEDDITLDDLKNILGKKRENHLIEGKSMGIEDKPVGKKTAILETCILKPLISFLNSEVGTGLLIFGVVTDKKDTSLLTSISGVDLSEYTSERIESLIKHHIVSSPSVKNGYVLINKPIEISSSKRVYLLEVEILERNCMFYSRDSNCSYIRKGSSTEEISLHDFAVMQQKRICSRVIILIDSEIMRGSVENSRKIISDFKGKYPLNISFKNIGFEPCKDAFAKLVFSNRNDIKIDIKDKNAYIDIIDIDINNTHIQVRSNIPMINNILYPGRITRVGTLYVRKNPMKKFDLNIMTNSEKGYTKQKYTFSFTNKNAFPFHKPSLIMEEDMIKREFVSYTSDLS